MVEVVDVELGNSQEEEQKDNQIVEQNPDHSVLESNVTPFIQSEKASQAIAGL